MFHKLCAKVAEALGETNDYGVNLDGSRVKKKALEFMRWESLSDLLPYLSYDEEVDLFINEKSMGFVFEVGLFIGSERSLENDFGGLFKNILPPSSNIQFLLTAMPKVDHIIDDWALNEGRVRKGVNHNMTDIKNPEMLEAIQRKRGEYFKGLTGEGKSKFRTRDFRGIVAVSVPSKDKSFMEKKRICDLRLQVKSLFEARGNKPIDFKAEDLINYLSDIFNYDGGTKRSDRGWNKYDAIKDQIIDSSRQYTVKENGIAIDEGNYEMRVLNVARYPGAWSFSAMNNLIGDGFNDYMKIPCPFVIHFGVEIESSKFKKTGMMAKAARVEAQATSPLGNWIPALRREAEEWGFVREQLEKDERLVKTSYQILLIDKPKTITTSEQVAMSLYRSNGWELSQEKFIVVPSLLNMIPLSWGEIEGYFAKKRRTTLSYEPVNMMPLQGEFKGTPTPGMLLSGRRGQLFYWYPFDRNLGNSNFNVSVVGRSGKGKSVFMQEIARSILRDRGRVFVLDVGRSFEKQNKALGGQFLEFTQKSNLCLNPFSTIKEDDKEAIADSFSILKPIISMMAAPKAGTTDYEDALIEKSLSEVWKEKGRKASIGDIAEWFLEKEEAKELDTKIGTMLFSYTREGVYGKYFNGEANVDFNSKYIVIELEELRQKKDLQQVVVQMLLLLISNKLTLLADRDTPNGLIFDEAWDLLQGKQGSEFIQQLSRTVRKYKGALITGTQNLDDFYSSPGAEAAFMNTDWLCCLNQKKESIELLKQAKRFNVDARGQKMLESVTTVPGEYAEIMIMTGETGSIGRLILEPFSRVLHSTDPDEVAAVARLEQQGKSLVEAVEQVAIERYGGNS